jgi:hypothetical protein
MSIRAAVYYHLEPRARPRGLSLANKLIAISGIGVIAIPTGILAAALSDAMQKQDDE